MPKRVQVGDGFAHSEGDLVQVERALEQHGNDVGCATGRGCAGFHHFDKPVAVVLVQLFNTPVKAGKRLAVGG
jgi:hypothetical protein